MVIISSTQSIEQSLLTQLSLVRELRDVNYKCTSALCVPSTGVI